MRRPRFSRVVLFRDYVVAEVCTLVADEDGRSGDDLSDLILVLPAKGARGSLLRGTGVPVGWYRGLPGAKPLDPRGDEERKSQ